MAKDKKILVVESLRRQLEVAKLLNGLTAKISNRVSVNDPIRISYEEAKLLSEIVVSYRPEWV